LRLACVTQAATSWFDPFNLRGDLSVIDVLRAVLRAMRPLRDAPTKKIRAEGSMIACSRSRPLSFGGIKLFR
jgi:hypothetical protein